METMRYGGMVYRTSTGLTTAAWGNGACDPRTNAASVVRAFEEIEDELAKKGYQKPKRLPVTMPGPCKVEVPYGHAITIGPHVPPLPYPNPCTPKKGEPIRMGNKMVQPDLPHPGDTPGEGARYD